MSATPEISAARGAILAGGAGLVAAALAAYHNTFSVPFLLDDASSILGNPTVQQLWPPWRALMPPHGGLTVDGRPWLNFSLAVNYAISGPQVWSYHLLNLAIHIFAGLALFGVVRRTLQLPSVSQPGSKLNHDALVLAFLASLLWVVHPLQTEAVTYVVQRAESFMGLWYLLTLYFFIRGVQEKKSTRWFALSVTACLLGMATKEVMVTAPLIVLLYDRSFLAGSFSEALRRRWRWYVGFAGTWLALIYFVAGAGLRGGTIGAGSGVAWWGFALTQSRAIVHYLRLALWPSPLIFDYGTDFVHGLAEIAPYALLDIFLLALTLWGIWRRPALGFLGAWFFLILAPSSSVVGGTRQMVSEHRAYLSLAAVSVWVVLGLHRWLGRRGAMAVGLVLAGGLGCVACVRNEDYRSPRAIWADTVEKRPENPWAHGNFGTVLLSLDRPLEAVSQFEEALRVKPNYPEAQNNLGDALLRLGRWSEAIEHYEQALRLQPDYASAHSNLANALVRADRLPEAVSHYEKALRLDPNQAESHNNFANALLRIGRVPEALTHYESALHLDPAYAAAHNNYGNALRQAGRDADARIQYEAALHLDPNYAEAHYDFANALADSGKEDEALVHYRRALELNPRYAEAHNNLGNALVKLGRVADAITQYEAAIQLSPGDAVTQYNLANAWLRAQGVPEAVKHYEEALRLRPDFTEARAALVRLGVFHAR